MPTTIPTTSNVERIAAMPDAVLRNLLELMWKAAGPKSAFAHSSEAVQLKKAEA